MAFRVNANTIMWACLLELSKRPASIRTLSKELGYHDVSIARALSHTPPGVVYIYDWERCPPIRKNCYREVYACELQLIHANAPKPEAADERKGEVAVDSRNWSGTHASAGKKYNELVMRIRTEFPGLKTKEICVALGISNATLLRARSWAKIWEHLHREPLTVDSWKRSF